MRPSDPLYQSQWHLAAIGDIERIWDEFSGAGVKVGVHDGSAQMSHPDLAPNHDPALRPVIDGVAYASTGADAHATAVAGLIGAALNGEGGVGVAWGASLSSVNFLGANSIEMDPLDPGRAVASRLVQAFEQTAIFDVVNHSWGFGADYLAVPDVYVGMKSGWTHAAATGRGGLGTIQVKSAGNEGRSADAVWEHSAPELIVVGALAGPVTGYSNHGASLLVSAPGGRSDDGLVTTDLVGTAGYNIAPFTSSPSDYTNRFLGTSGAAPVVSGVVALMLDAAPGLGWRDVQEILSLTAQLRGSAIGATGTVPGENGAWLLNGAADWNGGGRHFHLSYGYGAVDAFAAVRMAEAWSLFGGPRTAANDVVRATGQVTFNQSAPGFGGVFERTIAVGGTADMQLEFATLRLSVSGTPSLAGLKLSLVSPAGTEVSLVGRDLPGSSLEWSFGMQAFRGESSAGTWTIRLSNEVSLSTVTLGWASSCTAIRRTAR